MELFPMTFNDKVMHIQGLPDAVKLISISGKIETQLAHMALHRDDLDFAKQCLEAINSLHKDDNLVRKSLWHSAIIHYIKCFVGGSRRIDLDARAIYSKKENALPVFRYFKSLRDKHFIHDENAYTQCIPSAAINGGGKPYKVEKIFAMPVHAETLNQQNYDNLYSLIGFALEWVIVKFDELAIILTEKLEAKTTEQLLAMPQASFKAPELTELDARRNTP